MNTTTAKSRHLGQTKVESWWYMTAQGYRKMTSMSKMMKIIAIR